MCGALECDCTRNGGQQCSVEKEFSAEEFVDNLLTKGSCLACDETSPSFNNNELPSYYDENMYKRGQAYFHKHIFGMFLGNLLGLLSTLALESSLAILILTKMSSSNLTAYKRYVSTIFHMVVWYDSEFKPGSKLWESIKYVKSKHNSASNKSAQALKHRISQKDMALTQFGFMGLVLTRSDFLGIYDKNGDDIRCFVHVWRVIGYVLGISEEFNICRDSVEETRAICKDLISRIFKPKVEKREKQYMKMCSYLVSGMWPMNPFLNLNTFMFYLEATLSNSRASVNKCSPDYQKLTRGEKTRLHVMFYITSWMRFTVVRVILKYLQIHALWMVKTWPYLAYYKFGKVNSHVKIMGRH